METRARHLTKDIHGRFQLVPDCVAQITKLKIHSNPFAKGFRDSSRLSDFDR